jgi:hypothetical protein
MMKVWIVKWNGSKAISLLWAYTIEGIYDQITNTYGQPEGIILGNIEGYESIGAADASGIYALERVAIVYSI